VPCRVNRHRTAAAGAIIQRGERGLWTAVVHQLDWPSISVRMRSARHTVGQGIQEPRPSPLLGGRYRDGRLTRTRRGRRRTTRLGPKRNHPPRRSPVLVIPRAPGDLERTLPPCAGRRIPREIPERRTLASNRKQPVANATEWRDVSTGRAWVIFVTRRGQSYACAVNRREGR
jgi:hypothetical protein